jgi:hypothetical protein
MKPRIRNHIAIAASLFLIANIPTTSIAAKKAPREQSYAPGTIGYLYNDCKKALSADNLTDAKDSYCVSFSMGFAYGFVNAQSIKSPNSKNKECAADYQAIDEQLAQRTCFSLQRPSAQMLKDPMRSVLSLFFAWVDEEVASGNKAIMTAPATEAINSMIVPVGYCETIDAYKGHDLNKDMSKTMIQFSGNYGFMKKAFDARASKDMVENCKDALDNKSNFKSSHCAAEITGYLTGMNSIQPIIKNPIKVENEQCAPGIKRFYDSINLPKHRCLEANRDPALIAQKYIELMDNEKPTKTKTKAKTKTISTKMGQIRACTAPYTLKKK